ncbi:MAG TPA: cytochrome P460 family protein [Terracidiphilus sp.]|nr:cytochrome P460 family protein [Terracidiphilus sp.]
MRLRWVIVLIVAVFLGMQFVHPAIPFGPHPAEIMAPSAVKQVLQKDCYSCHSTENRLVWFDQVQPAYWLVRKDVLEARESLNFSTLGSKPLAAQKAALYESVAMMQMGAMPLQRFTWLHPEARVTADDLATLKAYLAPWSTPLPRTSGADLMRPTGARVNLAAVQPTANGQTFDPTMESWHLIATTDRGDNMQFRLILGNETAVRAAREGNVHPWPDGSRLAKFAWFQTQGDDGLIYPGRFWQVEMMAKDASLHKLTAGWGWGRWRGLELKPYGKNAAVVRECTSCHTPVRGNDDVYTEPISTASVPGEEVLNHNAAKLPAGLPYQPLSWGVIAMYIDPHRHTSSVLFGNPVAVETARKIDGQVVSYPKGSVLALVTWTQRDDPHWFGARIPDRLVSVEFVEIPASSAVEQYRQFGGASFGEVHTGAIQTVARIRFIEGLKPLLFP